MNLRTLIVTLIRSGIATAPELSRMTKSSQPTISRTLQKLEDDSIVLCDRNQRPYRYWVLREIAGEREYPVYRIDEQGNSSQIGCLYPVGRSEYTYRDDLKACFTEFDDIPWFISDMRPQGYLGRALALELIEQDIHVDRDPRIWDSDITMQIIANWAFDGVGNLVVGARAFERFSAHQYQAVTEDSLDELATSAGVQFGGSSAAGEQPKFACLLEQQAGPVQMLVKFSEPLSQQNDNARRWRDLLQCEHLALTLLQQAGLPAATSHLYIAERLYLILERFDRAGIRGRHGLVSLATLDAEYIGRASSAWPVSTKALQEQNIITPRAHQLTEQYHAFGYLICNTDMHQGNLSFIYDGKKPVELAPIYDMLPMGFVPEPSGMRQAPIPLSKDRLTDIAENQPEIYRLAIHYWQVISVQTGISEEFRGIAAEMAAQLQAHAS